MKAKKKLVLIIEDDQNVTADIKDMLAESGVYEYLYASDGLEALDLVEEHKLFLV